jgi:arginase family enzyme
MAEMDRYGIRDLCMPWYGGSPSFLRAPWTEPDSVPEGYVAVAGMPLDGYATSIGGTGMRWAPRRIREASTITSQYHGIQSDTGLLDILTGEIVSWPERLRLVDTGDVAVIPNDPEGQVEAAVRHLGAAARTAALTVTLGGDHFCCYPAAAGVIEGWRQRREGLRVGYLQIDSHTDFVDHHAFSGRYSHGTGARRVSEIAEVTNVAWFGLNGVSQRSQFETMRERGFRAYTSAYVHRVGVQRAFEELLEYLLDGVDIVYVTVDIDVMDASDAPATSTPVYEGLSAHDYLHVMRRLSSIGELVGLDLCEVNPQLDAGDRTEHLAVAGLLRVFGSRLFEVTDRVPLEELKTVFIS